jgi:hypothetical protein
METEPHITKAASGIANKSLEVAELIKSWNVYFGSREGPCEVL